MFNVHSWVRESLPTEALNRNSVERDCPARFISAPALNWFALDNRRHILNLPVQLGEIRRIAVDKVITGVCHNRFEKALAGYTEVEKLAGKWSPESSTVSIAV